MQKWIEVGFLLRGSVRAELAKNGIRYTETKAGWGSSVFVLDCSDAEWRVVHRWITEFNRLP